MQTIVELDFAYCLDNAASPSPQQRYSNVRVSLNQVRFGRIRQLVILLHEPLHDLKAFNHVWVTIHGQSYQGLAHNDPIRNRIIVSLPVEPHGNQE